MDRKLPRITAENAAFWTGGSDGSLHILKCADCDFYIHPPQPICPKCHTATVAPVAVSGRGRVLGFSINHQAWLPDLPVPYVVAIVELNEQKDLRLTTNIVNCAVDDVTIGMPVRVVFEQHEDVWLPLFERDA